MITKTTFILYKNNIETKTTSIKAVKILCDVYGWKIKHNGLSELI